MGCVNLSKAEQICALGLGQKMDVGAHVLCMEYDEMSKSTDDMKEKQIRQVQYTTR